MELYSASWKKYTLNFKQPSGTSRGILRTKISYFIFLKSSNSKTVGIGECGLLKGLSIDDRPDYEDKLEEVCKSPKLFLNDLSSLTDFPSIRFGLEMAERDYRMGGNNVLFDGAFAQNEKNIPINGLIWMGKHDFMLSQIKDKIASGFTCIKLKIGAIDFEEEMDLLQMIRDKFSAKEIELRVDANGAFSTKEALGKLERLAQLDLHSIEQPIRQGQYEAMANLCANTPLAIALDEELIGVNEFSKKKDLLEKIQPQYIILKPSLLGGFQATEEWINLANSMGIPFWVTSALESNIGLSAIAEWTDYLNLDLPQGLGTGQLYTNNFPSPLKVENGFLTYSHDEKWDLSLLTDAK